MKIILLLALMLGSTFALSQEVFTHLRLEPGQYTNTKTVHEEQQLIVHNGIGCKKCSAPGRCESFQIESRESEVYEQKFDLVELMPGNSAFETQTGRLIVCDESLTK